MELGIILFQTVNKIVKDMTTQYYKKAIIKALNKGFNLSSEIKQEVGGWLVPELYYEAMEELICRRVVNYSDGRVTFVK